MKLTGTTAAAAMLMAAAPLVAQERDSGIVITKAETEPAADPMADFAAMMGELFTAEPLTPEQEARLPLATEVVAVMTPPGFYADMMQEMMSSIVEPMFGMLSGPIMADDLLIDQVGVPEDELPDLTEEQQTRIITLLDPVAPQRAEAMTSAITNWMSGMFGRIEDPLREGFTRAFATRFTDDQLRDLQTFFATPTGALYARQTFSIYADPQVMSASMQMIPEMLGSMDGLIESLETAMADLPAQRTHADLSAAEREELAQMLGMSERKLRASMRKAQKAQGEQGN